MVVTGTASPHQIVDHEELAVLMEQRREKPLLVIDTAVPRDFDPAVRALPGVHLYDIDDLQRLVEQRAPDDRAEMLRAETVIEEELTSFKRWLDGLEVLPTITSLRKVAQQIVDRALSDNSSRWEGLTENDRERLEQMTQALVNRLLHEPTARLRQAADEGMGHVYAQAVRELFGLDGDSLRDESLAQPEQQDTMRAEATESKSS